MKKTLFFLFIFLGMGVFPVFAAKNDNTGVSVSPTGNQVKSQNQVQTKNQGEDSQLQVNTQEQEELNQATTGGSQNRSQNALEHMSEVATQVQQLLQVRTTGGIGEQVREIAQEQNQAQNQIEEQVNKMEKKNDLSRFLFGPDNQAIKNLKAQLTQNALRITKLEQLKNQLVNQTDQTMVQETIQALVEQNTELQEMILKQEKIKGLFGWLVKFFER